ncbi:MAG: benzoate/H(+) symporter BenE family transporter [Acidimicrobiales bacterium]
MNPVLAVTGGVEALLAPFGCPGLNLAAITAGLAARADAHPDAGRRWVAGAWAVCSMWWWACSGPARCRCSRRCPGSSWPR